MVRKSDGYWMKQASEPHTDLINKISDAMTGVPVTEPEYKSNLYDTYL